MNSMARSRRGGPPSQYIPHFAGPGRPRRLERMIELAKMSWSPVLEMLGREVRFEELAAKPYTFPDPPMRLPEPVNGERIENWLEESDVLRIHDEMISTFLGEPGIRDPGGVRGILDRMRESRVMGTDPFPTIFDKAAYLMHSILVYHPFTDGQKRTGLSAAFIFLGINGYYLWSRDTVDDVHFAVQVAAGAFDLPDVARWIRQRVSAPDAVHDPKFIERLLTSSAEVASRSCTSCRRRLRLTRYLVTCPNCQTTFQVQLNAGVIRPPGRRGGTPVVQIRLGLRAIAGYGGGPRRIPRGRARPRSFLRPRGGPSAMYGPVAPIAARLDRGVGRPLTHRNRPQRG
jgi:death on curing protein